MVPGSSTVGPAQSLLYSAPMTVLESTAASTGSEIPATSAESEGTSSALSTSALNPGSSIPTESTPTSALISSTAAGGISFSSALSTTVATSEVSGSLATTTSLPVPTTLVIPGDRVIFLIAPAPPERTKRVRKRDLGGFISTGLDENPPTCDQASVFILTDAQELFIGDTPLYYGVGDSSRQLLSTSNPPAGAVTRGFATVNGLLVFQNPALPNGEASFCQDATSGQVISKLDFFVFSGLCPNDIHINPAIIFYRSTSDVIIAIIYSLINDIFSRVCDLSIDIVFVYSHINTTFTDSVYDVNSIVCHPINIIFFNIRIYIIFSILLHPDDSFFFYFFTYINTQ
ncbi:hypothetical protein CGCSCA2_v009474 [Colletotrichum siamense]|uniref:DUF7908 domain-containing protein n=1 Tax=Colletotrichum siamense TaxID=690259 RepID=A0A9P5EML8_COLSI|nr:hypothetical protein CGCSCA2_v009474 [Colletotrichum siamense]